MNTPGQLIQHLRPRRSSFKGFRDRLAASDRVHRIWERYGIGLSFRYSMSSESETSAGGLSGRRWGTGREQLLIGASRLPDSGYVWIGGRPQLPSPDTRPGSTEWRCVQGRPEGGREATVRCGAAEGGRGPRAGSPWTRWRDVERFGRRVRRDCSIALVVAVSWSRFGCR